MPHATPTKKHLAYEWRIWQGDSWYLTYRWRPLCEIQGLEGRKDAPRFVSPPRPAIYKRDSTGRAPESAIYKRDTRLNWLNRFNHPTANQWH